MAVGSNHAVVHPEQSIPPMGTSERQQLVDALASQVISAVGETGDLERQSWVQLHIHIHGVAPLEYDIRHVPEELYLEVLAKARQQHQQQAG